MSCQNPLLSSVTASIAKIPFLVYSLTTSRECRSDTTTQKTQQAALSIFLGWWLKVVDANATIILLCRDWGVPIEKNRHIPI
jgi:hypothetical protein